MSTPSPFARTVAQYGSVFEIGNMLIVVSPWRSAAKSRIYFNGFPIGTPAGKCTKKNSTFAAYAYRSRGGGVVVDCPDANTALAISLWLRSYASQLGIAVPEDGVIKADDDEWRRMVFLCNGAGATLARGSMASATVLRRTYSTLIGTSGTSYPSSVEMKKSLEQVTAPFQSGTWGDFQYEVPPRFDPLDTRSKADPQGLPDEDLTVVRPAAPSSQPDEPLPAPAGGTASFDPDAMTHRDLVDLARKGSEAAAIAADRDRAIASRVKAEQERDAAMAERDEAIKRATMVQPVKVEVVKGDGTVEIGGVTLPTFEGGHGPAPTDGYDLTAWRAVCKVSDFEVEATAPEVAASIMAGDSVRLVGPPSVGKTSGIREVCAITGAKFFLVPCGEGATDLSLIAERVIDEGGRFVWRDGFITQAVRWAIAHPDTLCVAVLDEVDHLVPEVQSLLHSVLEGGHLAVNPDETLTVPSNIRFVATANTSGMGDVTGHHASAKVSDTAFTSRWNATYTVAYLPEDAETRLLVNAGAPATEAEQAVRCAGMTRCEGASVTQPIVLRQLLAWARACGRGEPPRKAWAWRVMTSTPEHDRAALRELTRTCFSW